MAEAKLPEIPSNSRKARSEPTADAPPPTRPEIKQITQGVRHKQGIGAKFKEIFIADTASNVKNYVLIEVVYPKLRRLFFEAGNAALERTFLGGAPADRRRTESYSPSDGGSGSRRYSKPVRREPRDAPGPRYQTNQRSSDGVIVPSREKANEILDTMDEILKIDGCVTAHLLYELSGVPSDPTDFSWGWTSLTRVSVTQHKDGWLIDMPAEEQLK